MRRELREVSPPHASARHLARELHPVVGQHGTVWVPASTTNARIASHGPGPSAWCSLVPIGERGRVPMVPVGDQELLARRASRRSADPVERPEAMAHALLVDQLLEGRRCRRVATSAARAAVAVRRPCRRSATGVSVSRAGARAGPRPGPASSARAAARRRPTARASARRSRRGGAQAAWPARGRTNRARRRSTAARRPARAPPCAPTRRAVADARRIGSRVGRVLGDSFREVQVHDVERARRAGTPVAARVADNVVRRRGQRGERTGDRLVVPQAAEGGDAWHGPV